jgi:hypothetical protein
VANGNVEEGGSVMTVVALAGRRIDMAGAEPARFPLDQVERVKHELLEFFGAVHPSVLVCSAACGADLLALESAAELGIATTIVLPFNRTRFRASSVVDRPGNWGPRFDKAMKQAAASGHIEMISAQAKDDDEAYALVTTAILDRAENLAKHSPGQESNTPDNKVIALVVWDGAPRGPTDLTEYFRERALTRGFTVQELITRPIP